MIALPEEAYYEGLLEKARRRSRRIAPLARYQSDPIAYAREILGVSWWERQNEIAVSVRDNPRTLVKAAYGVGKTFCSGGLVNWFFDAFPNSIIPTTAPTGHQVKDLLWKEIRDQRKLPPEPDILQLRDPSSAGHYAVGFSPQKNIRADEFGAQAAQGFHAEHLLFVMDEAAGVRPEIWMAMDGVVVGANNRALAIGNPTVTSGPYFDAARSGKWNVITISALEHPNIAAVLAGDPEPYPGAVSLEWLEGKLADPYWCDRLGRPTADDEREKWITQGAFEFPPGSDEWYQPGPVGEAKILGRFPTTTTDTVWALSWLERARTRELKWGAEDSLEIGVDVARFGDDSTTFHARRGPCSLMHTSWHKADNMETAGRIKRHTMEVWEKMPEVALVVIRLDTTGGHGAGPADRLRELFPGSDRVVIEDVNSSERARDHEHYPNRRSELWFATSERGRAGDLDMTRLDPRDYDALSTQLTSVKFKYDSQGRRVVEPKNDMKRRMARSPDDADGMNLAYAGGSYGKMGEANVGPSHSRWEPQGTSRDTGSRWSTGGGGTRRRG